MDQKIPTPKLLAIALSNKDSKLLAQIFELPEHLIPSDASSAMRSARIDTKNVSKMSYEADAVTSEWQALVQLISSLKQSKGSSDSFEVQRKLHSQFNAAFATSLGNWCVPALHVVCRNTFHLADSADGNVKETCKEVAVTLLQESFSRTLNDRTKYEPNEKLSTTGSKKCGVLLIVNLLFRIYFKLNKLRLCKNLLKPVEVYSLHKNSDMTQRIVFNYYTGRLFLFEDNFDRAQECLEFCMKNEKNAANRRRVLNFLVPVKLLKGRLPDRKLLETYSMKQYVSLIDGLRTGDLAKFSKALDDNSELFLKRGIFLLLEKCKFLAYRNLFKRCWIIGEKLSQIPLETLRKAFEFCGNTADLDEIECIMANLIYKGYIRGYLSHSKRVLVLSKRDPFPVSAIIK